MLKTIEPRWWVYVVHCAIVSTFLDVSNFNERLKLKKTTRCMKFRLTKAKKDRGGEEESTSTRVVCRCICLMKTCAEQEQRPSPLCGWELRTPVP